MSESTTLRISQLAPGDKFRLGSTWLIVKDNRGKNLKCIYAYQPGKGRAPRCVLGRNSQQMVEVESKQFKK